MNEKEVTRESIWLMSIAMICSLMIMVLSFF